MKLPAFQFYVGDWAKDVGVQTCSLAARGLWIEMLCLMHESDRRGYLQISGKPLSLDQLARAAGCSTEDAHRYLQELKSAGVYSCSTHGIIYNRRMVKDELERQQNAERQAKHRAKTSNESGLSPPNRNGKVTALSRRSSSSSSTSVKERAPTRAREKAGGTEGSIPPEAVSRCGEWLLMLEELQKKVATDSFRTWLVPVICRGRAGDGLWLHASSEFNRNWLINNYRDMIADLSGLIPEQVHISADP